MRGAARKPQDARSSQQVTTRNVNANRFIVRLHFCNVVLIPNHPAHRMHLPQTDNALLSYGFHGLAMGCKRGIHEYARNGINKRS